MNALITKLRKLKIELSLVDGKLKAAAPDGVLTRDIVEEIKANKDALTAFIASLSQKNAFLAINKVAPREHYYLSSVQKRLYFLYQTDRNSMAQNMNMPSVMKLEGNIDRNKLEVTFRKLVERHESLRTYFEVIDAVPVLKIRDTFDFAIEYYQAPEADVQRYIRKIIRPFDLQNELLIRVGIVEMAPEAFVLVVDMHHIISDGISERILVSEFLSCYNDEPLPELKLQYKDYTEWEQSEAYQKKAAASRNFWLEQFAEDTTLLDLPYDIERPAVKPTEGSSYTFDLDAETTKRLQEIADKEGATMFMMVLAIFNIFLAKLSGQEDVVLGTPTAGRLHADLDHIIGMFVNTVPLRNYPKSNMRFSEFLSAVKTNTLSCFDHQAYQLESLIADLKIKRDRSRNSLFDFMFSFQNFEASEFLIPGCTIKQYSYLHPVSQFDITLTAFVMGDALRANFEYSATLFSEETIIHFSEYFKKVAVALAADAQVMIGDIDVFSESEKQKLLYDYNDTSAEYAALTIVEFFERQVRESGDRVALICGNETITYAALNEQANRLAHFLKENYGVIADDTIGIKLSRSAYMIAAILGVLKSGAAFVPVDPFYPHDRILHMVKDSSMKLLITDDLLLLQQEALPVPALLPDTSCYAATNPDSAIRLNHLAYIIYTSGSTGLPKGVMIEHQALADYVQTFINYFKVNHKDVMIQQASVSFDTAIEEIFPVLIAGGQLVVQKEGGKNTADMISSIEENKVTLLSTTPLVLNVLNEEADRLQGLRAVISGGDELKPAYIDKLLGVVPVYNTYGPTESTVCASYYHVGNLAGAGLIGTPVANRRIYILDKHRRPVATGVAGEIVIGGKGLARGYLNNPELTTEKFIESPFVPGERLYTTGDAGKWTRDGQLQFLGRMDSQVKIRGFRIEPGEVEAHLSALPFVKECAVAAKTANGDKVLVAYYVAEAPFTDAELRSLLATKLPAFMVPSYFIRVDSMPVTASGKINRRLLPEPDFTAYVSYKAPETATETALVQLWADILQLPAAHIGTEVNFFEIGGHSLRAMVLVNKIFKQFDVSIPLQEILVMSTVKQMADYIESEQWITKQNATEQVNTEQFVLE